MPFEVMKLPYSYNALEPNISAQTMMFHHDRHYRGYIENLNELVEGSLLAIESLESLMLKTYEADKKIYQNAAQAWNHEFYWNCLSPAKQIPSPELLRIIEAHFGSQQAFKVDFARAAQEIFGSGWVWVVRTSSGELEIQALEKAENPLVKGDVPIFVCDVWEHAYYLDYQNERAKYVSQVWDLAHWGYFERNIHESLSKNIQPERRGFDETRFEL